jgi:hypothetical protein
MCTASYKTPVAVSYLSAITKATYMTAAKFVSCSHATSGQRLNGADVHLHSTHARPPTTNSAITTFASRNADLSTSGSYSHSRMPIKMLYSESCGRLVALRVFTSLLETTQSWRHCAITCAPCGWFLPAPPSLCTTNCVLLRDWVR